MRYVIIATVLSVLTVAGGLETARAVGYDIAGKEKCVCSPLVSRGLVPDTLNSFTEALVFPRFGFLAERLALEVKAILGQFGIKSAGDPRGRVIPKDESWGFLKKLKSEKKRLAKSKKKMKKRVKKRKVKIPQKAR
jgi:hypothetical protein